MLTGENGILTQAQNAKEETENAMANEASILGRYEDVINVATSVTGGEWNKEKGVNTPTINKNINMQLVRYEDGEWIEDETGTNYSYVAGTEEEDNNKSEWANVKVTIDGIESYFVWIPRYAYKIEYNNPNDKSQGGTIDVKFLIGTTNQYYDDEGNIQTAKRAETGHENTISDYYVHPAFTSDINLGGWRTELTGIWVGKYESSLVDKETKKNIVTTETGETSGNILLSANTDKAIAVQPNMSCWNYCTIGNLYTNFKDYSKDLNSHMLKNSEWGAVAYLAHSKYGRNGVEIDGNDENIITASGNIEENVKQSSTGNVYGIYDLSGGESEFVAAYYTKSTNANLMNNGEQLVNETNKEFVTGYDGVTTEENYKLGDATYETSGWNGDSHTFIDQHGSMFFRRGLGYTHWDNEIRGIFAFHLTNGRKTRIYISYMLSIKIVSLNIG